MSLIVTVGLLIFLFCFGMSDNAKNNAAARRDKQRAIETGSTWYMGGGYKNLYSTKGDRLVEIQYDKYTDRFLLWDVYKGYWLEEDGKFVTAFNQFSDQRVFNQGKPKEKCADELKEEAIEKGRTVYSKTFKYYELSYPKIYLQHEIVTDVKTNKDLFVIGIIDYDSENIFSYYADLEGKILRPTDKLLMKIDELDDKDKSVIFDRCFEVKRLFNENREKYELRTFWEGCCRLKTTKITEKALNKLYKIKDGELY